MDRRKGYILLSRSLLDHWLWLSDEPFDGRSAWIDLLLLANHAPKKIPFNRGFITIKRGQYMTSIVKLSKRWGWSRIRVTRYIQKLKKDGMLETDSTANGTLLTLVNYDRIQNWRAANDTTNDTAHDTAHDTTGDTTGVTQTSNYISNDINNEVNNVQVNEAAPLEPAPPHGGGEWQ